jgi:hypothetical protein
LSFDRRAHRADRLGLSDDRAAGTRTRRAHPLERRDGLDPHDAVGILTDVALELPNGSLGERPEEAVLLTGVEAERVQLPLERADVVSAVQG